MARAEMAVRKKRVKEIKSMILKGKNRESILHYTSEQKWGITDRQVDTYIQKANKEIEKHAIRNFDREFGLAIERLEDLYEKGYSSGNTSECRRIIETMNGMQGLNAPEKKEISGPGGNPIFDPEAQRRDLWKFIDEQMEKRCAECQKKLQ